MKTVMGGGGLIGWVVDNLLSNAFKYTDSGGTIAVEAENRGKEIVVRVRDNGQGIPHEFVSKIFTKFAQVTQTDGAPLRKGTGLGLAFCRLAGEAPGRKLPVETETAHGS